MNKQRKVVITITYNEMGIIIDTKAEEVAQPNLQPTCNQLVTDTISRQTAIDALDCINGVEEVLKALPSVQPEIVRCKDCKFYSPMNRETKTGICNLTMHQNFGDNWFCAGAERRTDEQTD